VILISLGIVRAGAYVSHSAQPDELVEVASDELRAVVSDNSRMSVGELFSGSLQDNLDIGFAHRFAEFPVNDVTTTAIQDARKIVERAADVHVADVDVPVLVGRHRLLESSAFGVWRAVPPREAAGTLEDSIDRGRAGGHHIGVHHHVGQPAVAFQRMLGMEAKDCFALPSFKPMIAGYEPVVLVHFAVPLSPVVELAHADPHLPYQLPGGQFRPPAPLGHVIDDFIPYVMRHPLAVQSAPSSFFKLTFSSISSAITSFFVMSLARSAST
jgi:hypothetical protein